MQDLLVHKAHYLLVTCTPHLHPHSPTANRSKAPQVHGYNNGVHTACVHTNTHARTHAHTHTYTHTHTHTHTSTRTCTRIDMCQNVHDSIMHAQLQSTIMHYIIMNAQLTILHTNNTIMHYAYNDHYACMPPLCMLPSCYCHHACHHYACYHHMHATIMHAACPACILPSCMLPLCMLPSCIQ